MPAALGVRAPAAAGHHGAMSSPPPSPSPTPSACPAERFLDRGRLVRTPRRHADRDLVLEHLASRALAPGEACSEVELTERLADLTADPVRLRRDLVEAGLVGRRADGSIYWRERSTPHDDEADARPRPADPWP
jgi:hypothetical protein